MAPRHVLLLRQQAAVITILKYDAVVGEPLPPFCWRPQLVGVCTAHAVSVAGPNQLL